MCCPSVHGGCGMWGVIAVPLFSYEDSIFYHGSETAFKSLGWAIVSPAAIYGSTQQSLWCTAVFWVYCVVLQTLAPCPLHLALA